MALLVQLSTFPDLGGDLHHLFNQLLGISLLRISYRSIYHRFTARVSFWLQYLPLYTILIINYWYLRIHALKYFRPFHHAYGIEVDDIDIVATMYFVRIHFLFFIKRYLSEHNFRWISPTMEKSSCFRRYGAPGCNRSDNHHLLLHQNSNGPEK